MSGYALLKAPLGGPWRAQKKIQETGKRFKEIKKSPYGYPHVGAIGATNISAIPALQPLKRHCKSAPKYTKKHPGPKRPTRLPPNLQKRNKNKKDSSNSILYPTYVENGNNVNKKDVKNATLNDYRQATKQKDGCIILCVGDSFTSGNRGKNIDGEHFKKCPYFKFLESKLSAEAQKGQKPRYKQWERINIMYDASNDDCLTDIKIKILKSCSDEVKQEKGNNFLLPLKKNTKLTQSNIGKIKRQKQRTQRKSPDIVILFGGINDLLSSTNLEDGKNIVNNLLAILSAMSTLKIKKCILCTIPKIPKEISGSVMHKNRMMLNEAILSMNNINIFPAGSLLGTETATSIVACNIAKEMDSDNARNSLLTWSTDGVHMKKYGYERVANYISQTLIKSSILYKQYKIGREKYERQKKKQEIKLRKMQRKKEEQEEKKRLQIIHQEANFKRKKELKSKAMAAGAPARENRWMRIADEESRSFESYFMKEAQRLADEREREKERKDTELMEEEDRLMRVYVKHLKKLAREEAKLVKVDNVIIKLISKRIYLTKSKLIASLFAVLPYPVPGKVIQSRIKGLFLKKKLERDKNFPEIIFHRPAMEKYFLAKKQQEEEEKRKLHAESLAAVKNKILKTAEDNKMESYAERLARLGGRNNLYS